MRRKKSLKKSLNIVYLVLSISTLVIIEVLVFSLWQSSNKAFLSALEDDIEAKIIASVEATVEDSIHVISFGREMLANNLVDLNDPNASDPYFVTVLNNNPEFIYSFSFGDIDGNYYGARRNASNEFEIMVSNTSTDFHSVYYSVTDSFNKGEINQVNNVFDPRSRAWYQLAVESDDIVFSPIYKHFVMDDLAISAASPVYINNELAGVIGAHIILNDLNDMIKAAIESSDGRGYIIDKNTGELVANSMDSVNFTIDNDVFKRRNFSEIATKQAVEAYNLYQDTGELSYTFGGLVNTDHIRIASYEKFGISWLFILELPNHPITTRMNRVLVITIILTILGSISSVTIWNQLIRRTLKPIIDLTEVTRSYSNGDYSSRAIKGKHIETNQLVDAFNHMADHLNRQRDYLEDEVEKRTKELEERNNNLKENQETIIYLSYHDQLTGLYNRRYFEDALKRLDNSHNLPISIIMLDMNGLKLINDAFGHGFGDDYLKDLSKMISKNLRSDDIAARYGGDEFVIILPKTDSEIAQKLVRRIEKSIESYDYKIVPLSVSFGISTKRYEHEVLLDILNKADQHMYGDKLIDSSEFRSNAITSILEYLKQYLPKEHEHAVMVQQYANRLGDFLPLTSEDKYILNEAAYMHDIGKISLPKPLLNKEEPLNEDELKLLQRHCEVGFRILNAAKETADYAEIVLCHHENWDGSGYPNGYKENEIPLLSRMIRVCEAFSSHITNQPYAEAMSIQDSIEYIRKHKGSLFDPQLVDLFIDEVL